MNYEANMTLVDQNNIVAVGEVIIDDIFLLKRVMVISMQTEIGKEKWFVSLPDEKRGEGWKKCISLSKEEKEKLDAAVILSLRKAITRNIGNMPQLDIMVTPVNVEDNLKAFVRIKYGNGLEISDIRIIEGRKGLFVAYPSTKTIQGYMNVAVPTAAMVKDYVDECILEAYRQRIKLKQTEKQDRTQTR